MNAEGLARKAEELLSRATAEAEACASTGDVEALRGRYLGRKGELTRLLRELGTLAAEEKRAAVGIAERRRDQPQRDLRRQIREPRRRRTGSSASCRGSAWR